MASNSSSPYDLADKAIALLNKKAIRRFQTAQRKLNLLDFDELNVIQVMDSLYESLDADNKAAFLELAQLVYRRKIRKKKKDPDLSWLLALLDEYDPVTKYRYTTEVVRKKEYTTEAVIASPQKAKELQRGLKYWSIFSGFYADIVTEKAVLKAFNDDGVKKVMWHTAEDERVCETCGPRDKKIYTIGRVPEKPHLHCRCWLTVVKSNE